MMAQSSVLILQVILMAAIILMSVLGNLLVVASVLCVRSLRQPPNLLLLALAITDLFVSLVVMPGALLQEVVGAWPLSPLLCVAWVFADVFLCTSSILSLTAICIGKYSFQTLIKWRGKQQPHSFIRKPPQELWLSSQKRCLFANLCMSE